MRFAAILAEKAESPAVSGEALCEVLEVTVGGLHAFEQREPSEKAQTDAVLLTEIQLIFEASYATYGSPRIYAELTDRGFVTSRKRVARLMQEAGLCARMRRKWVSTTDSTHDFKVYKNVIERKFAVEDVDTLWLTDITYIHTTEGFMYLSALMDAHSRRIIGYAMDDHMRAELCTEALSNALSYRAANDNLIHHSDRGSQYASGAYQDLLEENHITCSMSRVGQCWDNAMMESFFSTLKLELLYRQPLQSKAKTKKMVINWIEGFYNTRRRHSALGYISPMLFEKNKDATRSQTGKNMAA